MGGFCGGGVGGGRVVAACEMLRPSVDDFEQAQEVFLISKSSLTDTHNVGDNLVKDYRTVTTQDQSQ